MQEAIRVVGALHALGVRHADVDPRNILVVGSKVFFIDFGFATLDDSEEKRMGELDYFRAHAIRSVFEDLNELTVSKKSKKNIIL